MQHSYRPDIPPQPLPYHTRLCDPWTLPRISVPMIPTPANAVADAVIEALARIVCLSFLTVIPTRERSTLTMVTEAK